MNIQPITPPLRPGQELQCSCGAGATVADRRPSVSSVLPSRVCRYTVELSDEAEGLLEVETRHASDEAAIAWARALRSQPPASLTVHLYPSPSSGLPLFAE